MRLLGAGSATAKFRAAALGKAHLISEGQVAPAATTPQRVVIYAWVSSAENKSNLGSQAERLAAYSAARGYQVAKVVKEVRSGVNDARPKLLALLEEQSVGLTVVERK